MSAAAVYYPKILRVGADDLETLQVGDWATRHRLRRPPLMLELMNAIDCESKIVRCVKPLLGFLHFSQFGNTIHKGQPSMSGCVPSRLGRWHYRPPARRWFKADATGVSRTDAVLLSDNDHDRTREVLVSREVCCAMGAQHARTLDIETRRYGRHNPHCYLL